jgi:hypothetical protein
MKTKLLKEEIVDTNYLEDILELWLGKRWRTNMKLEEDSHPVLEERVVKITDILSTTSAVALRTVAGVKQAVQDVRVDGSFQAR